MNADDEIVQAFLEESREDLDQVDVDLVALESQPSDAALLARVFRAVHTVKGTCGFLGFARLEALAHAGENVLVALRDGNLALDSEVTTSLLRLVDAVRTVLHHIETTGAEPDDDHGAVVADLERHLTSGPRPETPAVCSGPADEPVPAQPAVATADANGSTETSVRVDVSVLDKLLDLVGELVLARSQIGDVVVDDDGPLAAPYRQLRLVADELQDGVMRARLQPVGTVTGKFRRIARDLATALGKSVRVELEGEDVGVDKAVNEALRDPLLHLVRNAVDHGIESPAERLEAGKPAEGVLAIRAHHEGGRVYVDVSDDGRGIDGDRLAARSVATGDLSSTEADTMTTAERLELMFRPGLSTKDEVTTVSGRGVGMDVVRANLEHVGGSIEVTSAPGAGTSFRISVPLTLAILPALVVWSGGGRYAVPQVDVEEVLRLEPEQVADLVDEVGGARLYRLRGRLLPLVDLAHHLQVVPDQRDGVVVVVVVRTGGRRFGLVVDAVADTVDAVVKPLARALRSVPVFSGVTILGDGQASLILDVAGVAVVAAVGAQTDEGAPVPAAAPTSDGRLLLATGTDGGRFAFRLNVVERLERFSISSVERAGAAEVVQYDGTIVPVVRIGAGFGEEEAAATGPSGLVDAVMCASSAGPVAVVVRRIDDVVPEPAPSFDPSSPANATSLVVEGRVTELVDVEALVAAAGVGRTR